MKRSLVPPLARERREDPWQHWPAAPTPLPRVPARFHSPLAARGSVPEEGEGSPGDALPSPEPRSPELLCPCGCGGIRGAAPAGALSFSRVRCAGKLKEEEMCGAWNPREQ